MTTLLLKEILLLLKDILQELKTIAEQGRWER